MELQGIIVVFYEAGSDSGFKGHTPEAVIGLFGREPNFYLQSNQAVPGRGAVKKGILRDALLIISPRQLKEGLALCLLG